MSTEYAAAKERLTGEWAARDKRITLGQIVTTIRLAEEAIGLRLENEALRRQIDRNVRIQIYYVHRLRAELERAQALIRELRAELRRRDAAAAVA